jgi:hypothetical protein
MHTAATARRHGREGDGGRGRPGRVQPVLEGAVLVASGPVEQVVDGGDHWEVPPARGAGEGGRRGDEKGGSVVAGARAREEEREQRAGGSEGDAGDGGPI